MNPEKVLPAQGTANTAHAHQLTDRARELVRAKVDVHGRLRDRGFCESAFPAISFSFRSLIRVDPRPSVVE